ncbi:ATP-dependent Clp protease proteolytic subunit [Rosistilla oblonga]|uniref:ATP-dependent Clp protease proteolytic subunit n=1 Tax=Rosistilla oblonga TaxID=2527990 RepID=UPI003A979D82
MIHIDADIGNGPGEISARWFQSQLPTDGSPITVRIHSEGGSVFEALAIFDQLDGYRGHKRAIVSSAAFSAASLLLCAFDHVEITQNGYTMVHSPYMSGESGTGSEASLLQNLRGRMVAIYAAKTGQSKDQISRLLDQESFFDAEATVALGLANRIAERESLVVAKLPRRVLAKMAAKETQSATARWKAAVAANAKTMPHAKAAQQADLQNPGLRQQMIQEVNIARRPQ